MSTNQYIYNDEDPIAWLQKETDYEKRKVI